MWATGEVTGEFTGSVEVAGREGSVEIIEIEHDTHIPTDVHTGAPVGKRIHTPFKVRAAIDKATSLFYRATTRGEKLPTVEFKFYMIDDTGNEVEFYNIMLGEARCVTAILDVPNVKNKTTEHFPHMVELWFVYENITWTFVDGAITYTDDWLKDPMAAA
jgi:type VI secretion system secreted protein Hcp